MRHDAFVGGEKLGLSRRRVLVGGVGAMATLAAPAIVRGQSSSLPDQIKMGTFPVNTVLMSFNQGTDLWRQQGLNIEFVKFLGGPEMVNAVVSNSIPAAEVGVGPALLAALKGAPLYYFTLGSISGKGYPFTRIMVAKDSPMRGFSDLAGKTLALHQRGTMEHISLGAGAAKNHFDVSKISIQLIPAPNQPQVLAQKQVDAIYALPPFDIVAEKNFGARTLAETIDFVPYLGYTTLALHRKFVEDYPDAVRRLLKGWILNSRWVDDNTPAARRASNQYIGINQEVAAEVRIPFYARNGLSVIPNVWHVYYMFLAAKIVDPVAVADLRKVIDEYFIQPTIRFSLPALDDVGRQDDPVVKDFLNVQLPLLPEPTAAYRAPWEAAFAH
jgi:ABC-type nitrate/sulfonate/bicarbonate transport system substrate-binding protein